jgi:hypothetical protein
MRATTTSGAGAKPRRADRLKSAPAADGPAAGTVATLKQQAAEKVAELAGQMKGRGESLLSRQKERAAGELEHVARSIRASAASLQDGPLAEVGGYVEAAADRLDDASRYLAEQDWAALRRDAEQVVQRQPALFLGGMLLAGLALGRFLKATAAENTGVRARTTADPEEARRRPARAESRNGARRATGDGRRRQAE